MNQKTIKRLAQFGLLSKGVVYVLLGALAFMAAFELGGTSETDASQSGAFEAVQGASGGTILLAVLTLGLVCYCLWRFIQAFSNGEDKKWTKRIRYFLAALRTAFLLIPPHDSCFTTKVAEMTISN